jgi:hypothetical protein
MVKLKGKPSKQTEPGLPPRTLSNGILEDESFDPDQLETELAAAKSIESKKTKPIRLTPKKNMDVDLWLDDDTINAFILAIYKCDRMKYPGQKQIIPQIQKYDRPRRIASVLELFRIYLRNGKVL